MSKSDYDNTSAFIKDSWAVAVEWYLSLNEYRKLRASSYLLDYWNDKKSEQKWPEVNRSLIYSPLFVDMVDDDNQSRYNSGTPDDEVSGYTLPLIDGNLVLMKNYVDVETFMKNNRPENVTVNQINKFLKLYKEKWIN